MYGFFKDSGNISMMRLMSFMALAAAIVFAGYGLVTGKDLASLATLCVAFIGPAFMGKATQSFSEKDKEDDET